MICIHLFTVYPEIFLFSLMTKPLNTQNEWIILMLIGAVAGFCLVPLNVKEKLHKPKPRINQAWKEIYTANLGMKLTSVVCKLETKINLSKSKVKLHPYSKSISTAKCLISPLFEINMHHQCRIVPYSISICTTCQDLNQSPSACKLSVQTTTPPVLDTIMIEQQFIILPR